MSSAEKLPEMLSEYADPAKRIYKFRYCCYTDETPRREVIVYADKPEQALATAQSHYAGPEGALTVQVDVMEVGHIWVDEKGRQHTHMTAGYDGQLHVDQGAAYCECCKDKAGLPQAWRKK